MMVVMRNTDGQLLSVMEAGDTQLPRCREIQLGSSLFYPFYLKAYARPS